MVWFVINVRYLRLTSQERNCFLVAALTDCCAAIKRWRDWLIVICSRCICSMYDLLHIPCVHWSSGWVSHSYFTGRSFDFFTLTSPLQATLSKLRTHGVLSLLTWTEMEMSSSLALRGQRPLVTGGMFLAVPWPHNALPYCIPSASCHLRDCKSAADWWAWVLHLSNAITYGKRAGFHIYPYNGKLRKHKARKPCFCYFCCLVWFLLNAAFLFAIFANFTQVIQCCLS